LPKKFWKIFISLLGVFTLLQDISRINFCYGIDPLFNTPIFSYLKGGYEGGGTTLFEGDQWFRGHLTGLENILY
jgi:hypothetical protein